MDRTLFVEFFNCLKFSNIKSDRQKHLLLTQFPNFLNYYEN
jgi:hypothetical protein